jgi:siroheme synthase (precorrin-2 oxidase/ferrochelatase)
MIAWFLLISLETVQVVVTGVGDVDMQRVHLVHKE